MPLRFTSSIIKAPKPNSYLKWSALCSREKPHTTFGRTETFHKYSIWKKLPQKWQIFRRKFVSSSCYFDIFIVKIVVIEFEVELIDVDLPVMVCCFWLGNGWKFCQTERLFCFFDPLQWRTRIELFLASKIKATENCYDAVGRNRHWFAWMKRKPRTSQTLLFLHGNIFLNQTMKSQCSLQPHQLPLCTVK